MKAPSSLICTSAIVATIASSLAALTAARPMHAGIDYHRYLQEKDDIAAELAEWMSEFKDQAEENGWIPPSEARSTDEQEEDQRQRFFLTKQKIKELEKQNPDATFSTKSPFTLLTDEEFNTYVGNAYRKGDGDRRLRGGNWDDQDWSPSVNRESNPDQSAGKGGDKSNGKSSDSRGCKRTDKSKGKQGTPAPTPAPSKAPSTSKPAAKGDDSVGYEYDFSSLYTWRPSRGPATRMPSPVDNDADFPTTSMPVRTRAPGATSQPIRTQAPINRPTQTPARTQTPINRPTTGPVAPDDSTGPASSAVPIANDANSFDWSSSKCVAPPQNQGQCGSCWAFATVAAVEAGQCIANGKTSMTKYSEQQLTSCDTQNMGCNGGAPTYAYRYIQQNGLCTASAYPYSSSGGQRGSCQNSCSKAQTGLKGSTRVTGETGLIQAVRTRPVVVAVAAGNNAWKQYSGGVLSSCQTMQLDHAVLAVGYDATSIKIKNSWGTRWGEAGYIRLKRTGSSQGTCNMYGDMSSPNF